MNLVVQKTNEIHGACTPPGSKSHTIRAIFIALLAKGASVIQNALDSNDTRMCIETCRNLGVAIEESFTDDGLILTVQSNGVPLRPIANTFNTGDSGITTRFALPILGLREESDVSCSITCGSQMQARPIDSLVTSLRVLGMNVRSADSDSVWPLTVTGQLLGGDTSVDGVTSQFLSSLLISLPCAPRDSRITVPSLNERPYVSMTTRWLDEQGISYTWEQDKDTDHFFVNGGQQYHAFTKRVPADFSSASYMIAAGVLCTGEIHINGIEMNDTQGDKRLISILQEMGADIEMLGDSLRIRGGNSLRGREIDCNDIPDLVPTLAVIGTYATGTTVLRNATHARLKETDRIASMYSELTKLGANISQYDEGLTISRSDLRGAHVDGHDDHRTIMALAVAGLIANGTTTIRGAEGISKTFPSFIGLMQSLGALITTHP